MKKFTLIMTFFLTLSVLQAQDYEIGFTSNGTGTISSISVQNLTQGTEVTLNGDDVLHLLSVTTGVEQVINQSSGLLVYPNPMIETSSIEFNATVTGLTSISVFDITGKQVISEQCNLGIGSHVFKLNNLSTGIYTLSVKSDSYLYSAKFVCQNRASGTASLSYESTSVLKSKKSTKVTVEMQYTTGDELKITGISEGLKREIELVPTVSQTEEFDFTLMLGDFAEGGVVFYIFVDTDNGYVENEVHGLVCAVTNQSTGKWYNGNYTITNATGIAIGTGSANTNAILSNQGVTETDYAAGLARAYSGGSYNDWFLPSKDELNKMYENRTVINTTARDNSGTVLETSYYWSSTENSSDNAWKQRFNGFYQIFTNKEGINYVRAVRTF